MKLFSGRKIGSALLAGVGIIGSFASIYPIPGSRIRSLVLSVSALMVVVAFCLYISILIDLRSLIHNLVILKRLGIRRLFETGTDASESKRAAIKRAKTICIMAVSGEGLVKSFKDEIIYALRENCANVRVLLSEPTSEFMSDVEEAESRERIGHISPEIRKVESLLAEYLAEAKTTAEKNIIVGQVQLGYYRTHLRSSIVLCDNSWGWFTLNLPPKRAVQSPSFELGYSESSLLKTSSQHFERVWDLMKSSNRIKEIVQPDRQGTPPVSL